MQVGPSSIRCYVIKLSSYCCRPVRPIRCNVIRFSPADILSVLCSHLIRTTHTSRPYSAHLDLKSVRIGYPDVIPEPIDFCWRSAFKLNGKGSSLLSFARCVLSGRGRGRRSRRGRWRRGRKSRRDGEGEGGGGEGGGGGGRCAKDKDKYVLI